MPGAGLLGTPSHRGCCCKTPVVSALPSSLSHVWLPPSLTRARTHVCTHPPTPASPTCSLQEVPDADVHRGYAATQRLGALRVREQALGGPEATGHVRAWGGGEHLDVCAP